ncbi:hypothetical protein Tco_0972031 [Tanacetum coccineum]
MRTRSQTRNRNRRQQGMPWTCGVWTLEECCSIGSLEDKILTPVPDSSPCCAKCGTPVDGPYCRGCAFLRKKFGEDLLTYCGENETSKDFEDISESSMLYHRFVNALDDSLDGIFCQQCICKFCGKNAHYGYNCPPKIPIISNLEQCNQTIAELPQTLLIVHPTCKSGDKNSFTYDSKPHSFNDSPKTHREILQAQEDLMEAIQAFLKEYDHIPPNEKCMALLLAEERFLKIKQAMREEQIQPEVMQELLLKLMEDLQSLKGSQQEKKETAAQSSIPYWNFSMIDNKEARDDFLKDERYGKIKDALIDKQYQQEDIQELMSKLLEDVRNISEELSEYINCPSWNRPLFYFDDDDDEYTIILPNQKDLNIVIPIPSGIDERCFNTESDLLESLLNRDSSIDSTKIDSIFDEFSLPRPPKESKSEYSDATIESLSPSPIPVEDSDPFMEEIDIFLASDDSTPPGVESDYDSEGDILLLEELLNDDFVPLAEYHHFTFDIKPDTAVKNDFDELNEDECFDPGGGENVVFLNVEEDDSFTFTIRTFLPFVTYPEVSPLLSSTKNEDTIFDPGIST